MRKKKFKNDQVHTLTNKVRALLPYSIQTSAY